MAINLHLDQQIVKCCQLTSHNNYDSNNVIAITYIITVFFSVYIQITGLSKEPGAIELNQN